MARETTARKFAELNQGKANFDDIYNALDPREYYRVLIGLDYIIPDLAKPIFRSLVEHAHAARKKPPKMVDLGCSYGINTALIRFPLDLQQLALRYATPEIQALDPGSLKRLDRLYFRGWPPRTPSVAIGIDISRPAIDYARGVGAIDFGIARNLETEPLAHNEARVLTDVDLIFSTGCVGYVTEKTFGQLMKSATGETPWVASFVLRMFDYEPISAALDKYGLVTEKLEGVTFVQRRFRDAEEVSATLDALARRGIDPAGKESEGLLHAELYVSRPQQAIDATPLAKLLSVTSGASRPFGRRFRVTEGAGITLVR
jgi:SAM-dependent methyltransferase